MSSMLGMAALGLGGSLLGGLFGSSGAKKQAQAELQAAREQREFLQNNFDTSQAMSAFGVLGPQQAEALLRALPAGTWESLFGRPAANPSFTADQQRSLDDINRRLALPTTPIGPGGRPVARVAASALAGVGATITPEERRALEAQRDALITAAGGREGRTGRLDLDALRGMGPGVIDEMRGVKDLYDAQTSGLMGRARSIEEGALGFGEQERARINREMDRALTSANRLTESRLIGRGLGSGTLLTGAMSANARNIEDSRQDALGSLGDRHINLLTGIRGNALNLASARSDGSANLASAPINTRLQFLTGGIMNPWQQRDTSQLFPGVSSSGTGQQVWGNMLSGMGGQFANLGMMGMLAQDPNFRALFGGR